MSETVGALFHGQVFRPDEELNLRPNTRVCTTNDLSHTDQQHSMSFLGTARQLNLDGTTNWSDSTEDSLYRKSVDGSH
jgi:hypothetical protein